MVPRRVVAQLASQIATVIVVLALAAGCAVGPSNRPGLVVQGGQESPSSASPNAGAPRTLPPLESAPAGSIDWSDCTNDTRARLGTTAATTNLAFQCAQITSPLDPPSMPGAGMIRLNLLKVGSGATPLVVVNDVAGLPGTLYAARLAANLPATVLQTFSLIGVDRRGTGGVDGVHCVPQQDRNQILDYDPTSTDVSGLLAATTDASQQCRLDLDIRLAAFDTSRTAEDLEALRTQLGVAHLNAIGHGEGSRVLTVYADRYPTRVGRFVLDGAPEPVLGAVDVAQQRAASAEAAFQSFATACVAAGCPLGRDPTTTLTALVSQLTSRPLTVAGGVRITGGIALRAVLGGLADPSRWTTLAQALAAAGNGDGTRLAAFVAPLATGTQYDPPWLDAALAVGCNDQQDRQTPPQVSAAVHDWSARYPLFGGLFAQSLLWCAPWPLPNAALPKPTAANLPPILLVSTANDPVTPESGTQHTAQELPSGVVVSWQGTGHGAVGVSSCVTAVVARFLVNGQSPAAVTACPP